MELIPIRRDDLLNAVLNRTIVFFAVVILGHVAFEASKRDWKAMYEQEVIDRTKYYENRFKFF